MNSKPIDKIVLVLVAAAVLTLALLNVFQPNRPTVSESENRTLATWPEFRLADVVSGKYFADISTFFSDTFYGRETLVNFSSWLDQFKGIYDEDFSFLLNRNPGTATQPTDDPDDDWTLPPLPTVAPTQPPTTGPSLPPDPTDPSTPPTVIPISLSDSAITLTAGSTSVLTATVGTGYDRLSWTAENPDVADVTDNGDGTAVIKGLTAGTSSVSATVTGVDGQQYSCLCIVTVKTVSTPDPSGDNGDFLPNGLFIYKGAAYSQSYFNKTYSTRLGEIYQRFGVLFPNSRVSVVTAPLATITINDPKINDKISAQGPILDKIEAVMPDDVNFVNLKNVFLAHADEYLFFKSDHHWTQRGAYYAYYEYALSVGLTPTPIDQFEKKILSTNYIGSMYNYTKDDRVKSFYDTVEAYIPTKPCTMTIHANGKTSTYDFCINTSKTTYLSFINGDNGYTVINVPDNPQDMTALVFKDSYGNAFVPYLTEHYGNIIVIDARYVTIKALEEFGDMNITDIIFLNNTSTMTKSWYTKYYNMIT